MTTRVERAGTIGVMVSALCLMLAAPVRGQCVGDCNGSGTVTIDELVTGVNIALGSQLLSACEAFGNAQAMVDIVQLITGVNNALNGCAAPTALLSASEPGASLADPTTLLSALRIMNTGTTAAENIQVTGITLSDGTLTVPTTLPFNLGAIPVAGAAILDADFSGPSFTAGATYSLNVHGTYAVGGTSYSFTFDRNVTVPPAAPGSAAVHTVEASPNFVSGAPFPHADVMSPDSEVNMPGPPVPTGPLRGTLAPTTAPIILQGGGALRGPGHVQPYPASSQNTATDLLFLTNTAFAHRDTGAPNDPSGASGGANVVLTTGNTYGSLSVDGGNTFTVLDPTTIFPNSDAAGNLIDGGLCCDQIIHYSPAVNRFFWLMQFRSGPTNTNRLRLAAASPEALISSGGTAWTYWDLTSALFNLGNNAMDYPDLSVGNNVLYVSVDGNGGLLVARIPLTELRDSGTIHIAYTNPADSTSAYGVHLIQHPGDEIFWAGHPSTSLLRAFSWQETSNTYFWRDVNVNSYASADFSSRSPDGTDWMASLFSGGPGGVRIQGPFGNDEIWFDWTAAKGGGFPQTHLEVVRLNHGNFSVIDQTQIWNANIAFSYASFTANSNGLVGISVAFGGGGFYGTSAFGIFGDGVVYYPCLSGANAFRYGDYTTVRDASPNDLLFSGTGYCTTQTAGFEPHYVLFGRSADVTRPAAPPPCSPVGSTCGPDNMGICAALCSGNCQGACIKNNSPFSPCATDADCTDGFGGAGEVCGGDFGADEAFCDANTTPHCARSEFPPGCGVACPPCCQPLKYACGQEADCCSGLCQNPVNPTNSCGSVPCQCVACLVATSACTSGSQCCSGTCSHGTCQ